MLLINISAAKIQQLNYERIVLDNALYQYCKWVIETAKQLNITLLFLPSYSLTHIAAKKAHFI